MFLILFLVFCTFIGAESSCEKWGTFATIVGCNILEEVSEANLVPEYQGIFDMLMQGEISAWVEKKREPAHKLVDVLSEYLLDLERFAKENPEKTERFLAYIKEQVPRLPTFKENPVVEFLFDAFEKIWDFE